MFTRRLALLRFVRQWQLVVIVVLLASLPCASLRAENPSRCVLIEVYLDSDDPQSESVTAAVEEIRRARTGITLVRRAVDRNPENEKRLKAIRQHFTLQNDVLPVIYGCNRVIVGKLDSQTLKSRLEQLLTVEVFVRSGCSRCAAAKAWLPSLLKEHPAFRLSYRDLAEEPAAAAALSKLVAQHRTAAASVPVFHLCNSLSVGFDTPETSGERLRTLLRRWTHVCPATPASAALNPSIQSAEGQPFRLVFMGHIWGRMLLSPGLPVRAAAVSVCRYTTASWLMAVGSGLVLQEPPDLPLPEQESGSEDSEFRGPALPETNPDSAEAGSEGDNIEVPLFGKLSASQLGMPVFTIAIGLIDGFNPCAMWILLFLLSILVGLKDRMRILAIAGTFVVVSGLAYFAFMAAWLNVFLMIGYLRPIQIGLAVTAILIGSVHIKDYFAFKKGFSLSIPESAKPGIYARVRSIVTAEHLTGAVAGAIVLAVLVNIVELLCTAGLPALYTNILMQQHYSAPVRYGCLVLYVIAYMFDDGLMVAVVVLTLSRQKLQESHGRWLKLISGLAILLLGMVMLFRPEWLN